MVGASVGSVDAVLLLLGLPCLLWLLALVLMAVLRAGGLTDFAELRRRHNRALYAMRESERRREEGPEP